MSLITDTSVQTSIQNAREQAIIDFCVWFNRYLIDRAKEGFDNIVFPNNADRYEYTITVKEPDDCPCFYVLTEKERTLILTRDTMEKIINLMTNMYKYEFVKLNRKCKDFEFLDEYNIKFPIIARQPAKTI